MDKIKTFYKISEKVFFLSVVFLFLWWIMMKNDLFVQKIKIAFFTLDLPIIFFALSYWLLSIKYSLSEKDNEAIDAFLLFIGWSIFIFFAFIHLSYPNII